eukprot:TRINITY_DN3176_c3_g10_i1.p1 TRINITY_DN3176_c3_g10~~TRINITY_DN3176_c3_g10_i1.p1  ORF type:complete len:55 (+),score=1.97 TRINITY_DN3176_c3_g10_i1:193-357(+)
MNPCNSLLTCYAHLHPYYPESFDCLLSFHFQFSYLLISEIARRNLKHNYILSLK